MNLLNIASKMFKKHVLGIPSQNYPYNGSINNVKIYMKLEDPKETYDLFAKSSQFAEPPSINNSLPKV